MSDLLRNALFAALYQGGRMFQRAAAIWLHAAAGTVRVSDLRAAIRREWEHAGSLESDGYIASGLMDWERNFYPRFLKPNDRVLVIGCGTGRDTLALLQLGYRAEGLDVGPQCTATARRLLKKLGLKSAVYTGAIETVELPGRFDAFIFSWFCYSYIPQSETRTLVLRKLKAHLNPGGRILVTYVPAKTLPRHLPIRITQLVAWLTRSDWQPEYGDAVQVAGPGTYFVHYEHEFTREGLEEEARTAGLTVEFHERADQGTTVLIA